MELTLNLIWLVICLGASITWLLTYRPASGKCNRNQGLILLFCVSIILFPVISITDDLQEAAAYTEDRLASPQDVAKKAIRLAVASEQSPLIFIFACFALWFAVRRLLVSFRLVDVPMSSFPWNLTFSPAVEKRPPPAFALAL